MLSLDASSSPSADGPVVTIGLVTLNEERTIERSVSAILREMVELAFESELIVVAGGDDGTVSKVTHMLEGRDDSQLLVDSEPKGKPAALNRIIGLSRGSILVLSDGDVTVQNGAIAGLLESFRDSRVGAASGRVMGTNGDVNIVTRSCEFLTSAMHSARMVSVAESGTLELASGYLLAVRKDLVGTIPLDTNSDDGFISMSVLSRGFIIRYVPESVVKIAFPQTLSDYLRQKSRTRYGHLQTDQRQTVRAGRNPLRELREFARAIAFVKPATRWVFPMMVSASLLLGAWVVAYGRRWLPWVFRGPAWKPIPSTKR